MFFVGCAVLCCAVPVVGDLCNDDWKYRQIVRRDGEARACLRVWSQAQEHVGINTESVAKGWHLGTQLRCCCYCYCCCCFSFLLSCSFAKVS
ncbi:hypothetical protein B0J11DRAFT_327634 [Dendryphion nanum]|uniref:Secreted protein n=1 Tax=Dendryphion nanum TaxID=256645 RepID=A0A9P9DNQ7_9PLEO|nr:hypothetical protein B0J11DRAFT_327634 [Dendryphion nanum]